MLRQKIVVMGLGYIGLPTASMLATKGHEVVGVDVRDDVVKTINSGNIHIVEPDLDILVRSAVNSGKLKAALVPQSADTFILAVPTPFRKEAGVDERIPDISYVEAATRAIAPCLASGNLVVLESTSPVGTTDRIHAIIAKMRPDLAGSLYVAHCPERVLPGHILRELVDNDRIIGGINPASAEKAKELYRSFCTGDIFLTDAKTAEMAKLTENSFRDVNIAFANELSMICHKLGIDVWELIELANRHPRVNILRPGPGVGGHCIAVDPWFIVAAARNESRLIRTAREVNDAKPEWVISRIEEAAAGFVDPVIGCLGLAFKADVDDMRESPALEIVRRLMERNIGTVIACEPNINGHQLSVPLFGLDELLEKSQIIVILVDHREFKSLHRAQLQGKFVVDTRGVLGGSGESRTEIRQADSDCKSAP